MPPTERKGIERKPDFLPLIAQAFVDRGYRRTTTAQLAARCDVRENELYRIWPTKKAMFLDAIGYVVDSSLQAWSNSIQQDSSMTAAEQLIATQAQRRGEGQLHRLVFSGLGEADDPQIRTALLRLYQRFHGVLTHYVEQHRQQRGIQSPLSDEATAWALIGLGSVFDIQHDLGHSSMEQRRISLGQTSAAILNMTK